MVRNYYHVLPVCLFGEIVQEWRRVKSVTGIVVMAGVPNLGQMVWEWVSIVCGLVVFLPLSLLVNVGGKKEFFKTYIFTARNYTNFIKTWEIVFVKPEMYSITLFWIVCLTGFPWSMYFMPLFYVLTAWRFLDCIQNLNGSHFGCCMFFPSNSELKVADNVKIVTQDEASRSTLLK